MDAAYAGVTAMVPEYRSRFDGWEEADSIVVNPHKWLFTPFDLSAFYCRRMDIVRQAFSLVPDYLVTSEGTRGVRNLMDTGIPARPPLQIAPSSGWCSDISALKASEPRSLSTFAWRSSSVAGSTEAPEISNGSLRRPSAWSASGPGRRSSSGLQRCRTRCV